MLDSNKNILTYHLLESFKTFGSNIGTSNGSLSMLAPTITKVGHTIFYFGKKLNAVGGFDET